MDPGAPSKQDAESNLVLPQHTAISSIARSKSQKHGYNHFLIAAVAINLVAATLIMAFFPSLAITPLLLSSLSSLVNCRPQGTTAQADGLTQAASMTLPVTAVTTTVSGVTTTYTAIPTLPASIDETPPLIPNIEDPMAVNAQDVCPGYTASDVSTWPLGFTASLALAGEPCNAYGIDVDSLNLTVQYQSGDRLAVRIQPTYLDVTNSSFYLLPPQTVHQPSLDDDAESTAPGLDLQFVWGNEPSFWFGVIRKSTGDMLFNTEGSKLIFEDQFLEFATSMPANYNMYGLGEHVRGFRLGNNFTSTLWNADVGDIPDANLYGTHPFYLETRYYERNAENGNLSYVSDSQSDPTAEYESYSHGVYLRNAHGHEVLMREENVTWRTLGGSIDLYFFVGPTQPEVTAQYQKGAIGLPTMQQYWVFGYHQCRWGYANWTETQQVVDNLKKFNIPLETIWHDIDYMTQYRDFTNDPIRFGFSEGREFLNGLHANNQHYIPIIDSAVYIPNPNNASDAYPPYNRGHAQNAFMLNPDGSEYIGAVWPGFTVFPDWHSAGSHDWWTDEIVAYHQNVDFDGIWIDMSEASSFCVGSCGSGRLDENQVHPPFALPGEVTQVIYDYPEGFENTNSSEAMTASSLSASQASMISATATPSASTTSYFRTTPTPGVRNVDYPPYVLNNYNGALGVHGLAPNATHGDGVLDYEVHNLWGHQILNATYNALLQVFPGKRPFIIGRSTFAGSGMFAGHWGGDNYAEWRFMYWSIPQALSFSLFGIPMFGTDTCGFAGQSDEELCNRWMQLSAFFPFYRNHNTLSANSQEPYVWSSVIDATKAAMNIRYAILPYMYTLFFSASTTGSTVMRALAWEFPKEPNLASVDRQFMLGPSLMVIPVLTPGADTVDGVFPGVASGTVWYDWYNQTAVQAQPGVNTTIEAPLGHIPVYVRGGGILPMQEPRYTTTESRQSPWSLLAALSSQGTATGQLYLDDGESLETQDVRIIDLTATNGRLYASGVGSYQDQNALANVTILGVPEAPTNVTLNGMNVDDYVYNNSSKTVSIWGLESMTTTGAWNADWELAWS